MGAKRLRSGSPVSTVFIRTFARLHGRAQMMESKMELLIFPWFVFWLAFSVIVGVFASQRRNRSGFGWFVLALLISPVLAFLLCVAMKENDKPAGYNWRIPPHAQKQ